MKIFGKISAIVIFGSIVSASASLAGPPQTKLPGLSHAPADGLHRVRNMGAASVSAGGGKSNCWKTCFDTYNNCMDQLAKNVCVPQMKSCLALCDSLSAKPDM